MKHGQINLGPCRLTKTLLKSAFSLGGNVCLAGAPPDDDPEAAPEAAGPLADAGMAKKRREIVRRGSNGRGGSDCDLYGFAIVFRGGRGSRSPP